MSKEYIKEWAKEVEGVEEYLAKVPRIKRPSKKLLDKFRDITVTVLWGIAGRIVQMPQEKGARLSTGLFDLWMPNIRPLRPDYKIVGPAVTVEWVNRRADENMVMKSGPDHGPHHDTALYEAEETSEPGDVLVFATLGSAQGNARAGMGIFGDCMISGFEQRGFEGIVVDGCIRDGAAAREFDFPTFCIGTTPWFASRVTSTRCNVPVQSDGVHVNPGDIIVGDFDGTLVIPQQYAKEVIETAEARDDKEQLERYMLRHGVSIRHAYGPGAYEGQSTYKKKLFDRYRKMWEAEGKPKQ
jgi:4-hydroxy-4-methyl-2-oxoglutarate aldolase